MNRLFISGNYLVADDDADIIDGLFSLEDARYEEEEDIFVIYDVEQITPPKKIDFSQAAEWFDAAGTTPYSEATLRAFLQANTGSGVLPDVNVGIRTTVDMSSVELLDGNTNPKVAIAAPGVGYAIKNIKASIALDWNSAAYATNTVIALQYTTGSEEILRHTEILTAVADVHREMYVETANALNAVPNDSVEVVVLTGDPITGDSPVKLYISYDIVAI